MVLYHSLVGTYLRYGIASWGSAKTTALSKLQSLQNKVVRYITHSSKFTNVTNEYKNLGILRLDEMYFSEVGKFIYRHSKADLPVSFDEYYSHINHSYGTRACLNPELTLPQPRTELGRQSIKYAGVKFHTILKIPVMHKYSVIKSRHIFCIVMQLLTLIVLVSNW